MNLFNLFAKLSLDDSEYEKGLNNAGKQASSFSSKTGVAFKAAGKAITAVVGTVTALVGGFVALAKNTISYGDEIDKMSQKLGLSADAYQKWTLAAELAGAEISTLQTGIRQLNQFTQDLADGEADALLTLQGLGLGYDEFMSMNFDDQLLSIVTALQGVENQTDKVRLAQQLFGARAYQELLPLLNQEAGSLDELFASFEDLGYILDDEAVKASARLNDELTMLKRSFQILTANIGIQAFPQIEKFVGGLQQIINGDFDEGIAEIGEAISDLAQTVVEKLPQILTMAGDILIKVLDVLVATIADPEFVNGLLNAVMAIINKVIEILPNITSSLFTLLASLFDALLNLDWGELILNLLNLFFEVVFVQLPNFVFSLINSLLSLFTTKEGLEKLGKIGIAIAQGIINGLITMIESGINLVIDGINALLGWVGVDIGHITIPKVNWMADGGEMKFDGVGTLYAGAGEAGAEVVAQGKYGTGVATMEELRQSVYEGQMMAVPALVNGIVSGLSGNNDGRDIYLTLQIDGKDFDNRVVRATNKNTAQNGRKTLNRVTRYS